MKNILNEFNSYILNQKNLIGSVDIDLLESDMIKYLKTRNYSDCSEIFKNFLYLYSLNLNNHEQFGLDLICNFPKNEYLNGLEIAVNNNFNLANFLAENGYNVTTIDPKTTEKSDKITILKSEFSCDYIAGKNKGTNIKEYDFLSAISPCVTTEHIIRQGLEYEKPFLIALCSCVVSSLNGIKFNDKYQWYGYLNSLSNEVNIIEKRGIHYATNLSDLKIGHVQVEQDYECY